jgi:hypothetical protein
LQKHTPTLQVSLHSVLVDQFVHAPNPAGQVLAAWQPAGTVATTASRIASGLLASAAFSIAGVGAITARATYVGASSGMPVASLTVVGGSLGSGLGAGVAGPVHAARLQTTATMTVRATMLMLFLRDR